MGKPGKERGTLDYVVFALAAGLLASLAYVLWLPDVSWLKTQNPKTTAYIERRRARLAGEKKKFSPRMTWVGYDRISENLKHAVLVAEDGTFYQHKGIDWFEIRAAFERDLKERRFAYGGSTITQQLARNLFLSPSKNPLRKVKEMLVAKQLERSLSKRRIFELYLNIAEWGDGIYGAEAAAQAYFGKSAAELSPDEAVAMAVVLPSPRRHSPAKKGRYVERGMSRVLRRMKASGYLTEEAQELDPDEPNWLDDSLPVPPAIEGAPSVEPGVAESTALPKGLKL